MDDALVSLEKLEVDADAFGLYLDEPVVQFSLEQRGSVLVSHFCVLARLLREGFEEVILPHFDVLL